MDVSTTFTPNHEIPVHRWFRYSAGFSAAWVEAELARCSTPRSVVLDPFAGSATTLIAAQQLGVESIGIEAHPFVHRIASAKLLWPSSAAKLTSACEAVLRAAPGITVSVEVQSQLIARIYDPPALTKLLQLSAAIARLKIRDQNARELAWLALVSILRSCSRANTAPWQYVLPKKQKARVLEPFAAFAAQCSLMASDMNICQKKRVGAATSAMIRGDARTCEGIAARSVDLVLTSPPYPNNYDYADATRIEMSFLGEIARWADLHDAVRKYLIPSCSQHSHKENFVAAKILAGKRLEPIRAELGRACEELASLRERRAGKKTYDSMVAGYFAGMAETLISLARVVKKRGLVCFVVGDSAPYGVHLPVERWLGLLADAAGFETLRFDETRKRNIKWKNRKHRVPLREGRLWLRKSV